MIPITLISGNSKYIDKPFLQENIHKYQFHVNNDAIIVKNITCDRNNRITINTSDGLYSISETSIYKDNNTRFHNDIKIISSKTLKGNIIHLTDKFIFSDSWAGKIMINHSFPTAKSFTIKDNKSFLIYSDKKFQFFVNDYVGLNRSIPKDENIIDVIYDKSLNGFLILTGNSVYLFNLKNKKLERKYSGENFSGFTIDKNKELYISSSNGFFSLSVPYFTLKKKLNRKLPNNNITCITLIDKFLWFGSKRGAFRLNADNTFTYYASRRWLADDKVVKITKDHENSVLILTETGLSKINFVETTLAQKAKYFGKIQRLRHIRYGLSSENKLSIPEDLKSATLVDTDNDGLWTSMYLASELFRYAVEKDENALQNAYEAFEAMEKLDLINPIPGFPSRTYERDGYQVSNNNTDPQNWRLSKDGNWRWKCTTSSDESVGHFFVYALFAEIVPDEIWKNRAIEQITRQMDHIIDNDWYLVDWDGKPTKWGRWNPEYINNIPKEVGDRRLNSTQIISFLQTAYHFTENKKYKEKAEYILYDHDYLENILQPANEIGFVDGEILSDTWNHSDDELYFLTAIGLYKYAFSKKLQNKYQKTIQSHWELERPEKNPLWNFIYTLAGGKDTDIEESVWWLKEFPIDLIDYTVINSHRKDIEILEPNFRDQKTKIVLPPDERPLKLHNDNEFVLDKNGKGKREYAPYIFTLPYWLGRYVELISDKITN